MLQRGGRVNAFVVGDMKSQTLKPFIYSKIDQSSTIMTDEWSAYAGLNKDYNHEVVFHGKGQYVNGDCWTNGMENFRSIAKRTINGSYIHVSRKYMQLYMNECVFRFNNRDNKQSLILCFLTFRYLLNILFKIFLIDFFVKLTFIKVFGKLFH